MKTSEDAVNDAVVNPASRLMILLFGTWLVGALYPIPETIYYLIRGPETHGNWSWTHTPQWFDFQFVPLLGSFASKTVLVSGPIALFCVVCSALDRWSWRKVTTLSALSTLSMNALEDWARDAGWLPLTLYQALIVTLLLVTIRPLRQS
jgi:hypothetical protein